MAYSRHLHGFSRFAGGLVLAVVTTACGVAWPAYPPLGLSTAHQPIEVGSRPQISLLAQRALPPQGLYESCLPDEPGCLDELDKMAAGGFRLILNDGLRYGYSAKAIRAYADRANALGMMVILPVKYFPEWDTDGQYLVKKFPELASEAGCTSNKCFLAYYIGILRDHPALWGYYMADEIGPEYHDGLKIYSDFVSALDSGHPRLIVEPGTNDPMEIFFTFHSYMRDTTEVLGATNFPYGYIDLNRSLTRYTGESARMLQAWSRDLGLKHTIVLQAFAHPQVADVDRLCSPWPACAPFPNYEQMRAQRDQALTYSNPEMILWFYYRYILSSDNPDAHWRDLVSAAFASLPEPVATPTPRPQHCAPGWTGADVGQPSLQGDQSLEGDVWTVDGSGWDIWSDIREKADQFRYVWRESRGNGELLGRIVAQADTGDAAKAGLMFRKTVDPVSPYYAVIMTPHQGLHVQYRSRYDEDPISVALGPATLPVSVRVVRAGTSYSTYVSNGEAQWSLMPGTTVDLPALRGVVMAGLAVTSGNPASLSEARFEDVLLVPAHRLWLPAMTAAQDRDWERDE